jgi:hypothetical protein
MPNRRGWYLALERVALVALDLDPGVQRGAVDVAAQFVRQDSG